MAPGESAFVPAPAGDLVTLEIGHAFAQVVRSLPSEAVGNVPEVRRTIDTQLSLWRAPIDNETFGPAHAARWDQLGLRNDAGLELDTSVEADTITHTVVVPDVLNDIPRVGVRLHVGPGVHAVDWFGLGSHENYSDRCASARLGVWHTPVDEWSVPYVNPQHSGNRAGVRWLRLLDDSGAPLIVIDRMDDLNVTISRWTDEELDAAQHLEDLPDRDDCYVWISARERGVGSGACGPDTSPEHRVRPGTYIWSYRLR